MGQVIIVGTEIGGAAVAEWRSRYPEVRFVEATDRAATARALPEADAWIGRIDAASFRAAGPRLRWVHSNGAGIETVAAIPELVASDVIVTNTRGGHAPCIAEHTFAMLLALTRQIVTLVEDQRAHVWKRPEVGAGLRELGGATMVVLGFGNIGRAIARRAVAFDMRVLGVDRAPTAAPEGVEAIWSLDRLDEALAQATVLVVAVPHTAETAGLLDARRLALLPAGAYVVAVSRGGIVDEAALRAALVEGRLAGAGLDVLAHEPPAPDDPIWDAPNLILTPHCSGGSRQTRTRVGAITGENLRRFVADEPLLNICDKRAGF